MPDRGALRTCLWKSVANLPFLVGIFVAVGKIVQMHVCRLHEHAQVDNLLTCLQVPLVVVEGPMLTQLSYDTAF